MSEATQRWTVGDVRVTAVVEAQTDGIPPAFFFPAADEAAISAHDWLAPHFARPDGTISMRVQAFVLEAGDRLVVVDPCVGNGKRRELPYWHDQSWPFMPRFRGAGFDPLAVDLVVHTHLHVDHVGWDTHLVDGRWVPTFPRARHVYVGAEIDFQATDLGEEADWIRGDSITPIFEASLADVVGADADLGAGLRLAPTPGHTPGHASLWIESAGAAALLTGDAILHPVQCARPDLAFVSDADTDLACATRSDLLATAAAADALVFGAHFPTEPGGRVAAAADAWRFVVEPGGA